MSAMPAVTRPAYPPFGKGGQGGFESFGWETLVGIPLGPPLEKGEAGTTAGPLGHDSRSFV